MPLLIKDRGLRAVCGAGWPAGRGPGCGPKTTTCCRVPNERTAGTLLFDGSSLNGLAPRGEARWEVADGTISAVEGSGRGLIATTAHHANFELRVDFWIDDTANSGVFIRCPAEGSITQGKCIRSEYLRPARFLAHREHQRGCEDPDDAEHDGEVEHL